MRKISSQSQNPGASFTDYVKAWPQYPLPHNWLTTIVYKIMRSRTQWWKTFFIHWFIKKFKVDLSDAVETNPDNFEHFNAFFTRALKPEARKIQAKGKDLVCPVDGSISQFGNIQKGEIFQAKGRSYNLQNLLADHKDWIETFQSGKFITIYLSPKDYHRIHLPSDGTLNAMRYIPGRLFSVNPATTRAVPGLFARNERLICSFDTAHGKFLLIMVGALFVSGIETVWHGEVSPPHAAKMMHIDYNHSSDADNDQLGYSRGDEVGRFNMGSTVILLFEPNSIEFENTFTAGKPVRMGAPLAKPAN